MTRLVVQSDDQPAHRQEGSSTFLALLEEACDQNRRDQWSKQARSAVKTGVNKGQTGASAVKQAQSVVKVGMISCQNRSKQWSNRRDKWSKQA